MGAGRLQSVGRAPEFEAGASARARAPGPGRSPVGALEASPAALAAPATLLAQLVRRSPQERQVAVRALNARVGNRAVARAMRGEKRGGRLARAPTGSVATVSGLSDAVISVLSTIGLDAGQVAVFAKGEPVLFHLAVEGHSPTIAVLHFTRVPQLM